MKSEHSNARTDPASPSLDLGELEYSLTSLLHLSDSLNSIFDLDSLLDALVEQMLELTHAEAGCAGLRTPQGMEYGHFHPASISVSSVHDSPSGTGWPNWVLKHGSPYVTNDAQNDTVIVPEIRERFGIVSGMSIPILGSEKDVIAFFEVYNKKAGTQFTALDLKNSVSAAQIASLAIQNALTYSKLTALAAFSRSLTVASDLEQILEVVGHHLEIHFHRGAAILLPVDRLLTLRFRTPDFIANVQELEAATWCWEHGEAAGAETRVVPSALAHYLPLTVRGQVIGVLGLKPRPGAWFSTPQRELLAAFLGQSALAIEQGILEQRLRRLQFIDESERLQSALLAAVSHEVRAPLAAITAAVSALMTSTVPLDQARELRLLQTAESEAKRLNRLMNNLLNVTRLQAGMSPARLEPCDLLDLVGAALEEMGTLKQERHISVEIPPDLPLVPMDFDLITQVLVNLLSNAIKFSASDQPVHLEGRIIDSDLEVMVVDRGPGVPEKDLDRVFQKFQRLSASSSVEGLGLGLSICKEFIEAHHGRLHLENRPGGGTMAKFILPLKAWPAV
jgi:two-component system sensor histidine kinase KdpD